MTELQLTLGQVEAAAALGIDLAAIATTQPLMACVNTVVGQVRYEEIMPGQTLSLVEGLAIVRCLGQ